MKASQDIKGLRIISIEDGTQIGAVKDLVLNPRTGTLDFFIIDQPSDYFGAKVIPFADITGLGEFAVTIPGPQVIQDVAQNFEVQELLKLDVTVIGTKVLTKKGSLIGEVQEYLVDEETGKIASCIYSRSGGETEEVPAKAIITFGKELLIIDLAVSDSTPSPAPAPASSLSSDLSSGSTDKLELSQSEDESIDFSAPSRQLEEQAPQPETEFNLFEQRQLQYFIGKTVDKDIVLDNGDLLVAGEPMTEDLIRKITTRSKLMEITSYLHKN